MQFWQLQTDVKSMLENIVLVNFLGEIFPDFDTFWSDFGDEV